MPQTTKNIKKLSEVNTADLKGKRVILRCDFNVTVDAESGKLLDDLRIRKTLPTIKFLRDAGAKLILISHIEGKQAAIEGKVDSLEPVANHISNKFPQEFGLVGAAGTNGAPAEKKPLKFIKEYISDAAYADTSLYILNMEEGGVVLFENLRMDAGEKKGDKTFAANLARYADIYVNDAFAVSHRPHASVVALPKLLPHYAGFQLIEEIEHLSEVFNPPRPFVFILGGAKFETKLPLIRKFLDVADTLFLGGALLNDLLKAKGLSVGKSLVAKEKIDLSDVVGNPKLIIPDDVVVQEGQGGDDAANSAGVEGQANAAVGVADTAVPTVGITIAKKSIEKIGDNDSVVDVGPSLTGKLKETLKTAKFVLWNGPMGNYELGFIDQTVGMADAVIASGVQSVLGGGDTTASLAALGLDDDKTASTRAPHIFVSTGGGAMLEFLQNETLPGIEALE